MFRKILNRVSGDVENTWKTLLTLPEFWKKWEMVCQQVTTVHGDLKLAMEEIRELKERVARLESFVGKGQAVREPDARTPEPEKSGDTEDEETVEKTSRGVHSEKGNGKSGSLMPSHEM